MEKPCLCCWTLPSNFGFIRSGRRWPQMPSRPGSSPRIMPPHRFPAHTASSSRKHYARLADSLEYQLLLHYRAVGIGDGVIPRPDLPVAAHGEIALRHRAVRVLLRLVHYPGLLRVGVNAGTAGDRILFAVCCAFVAVGDGEAVSGSLAHLKLNQIRGIRGHFKSHGHQLRPVAEVAFGHVQFPLAEQDALSGLGHQGNRSERENNPDPQHTQEMAFHWIPLCLRRPPKEAESATNSTKSRLHSGRTYVVHIARREGRGEGRRAYRARLFAGSWCRGRWGQLSNV